MLLINDYIKEKRLELSASILNRTIIYLDTKFWNNLRKGENPIDRELLNKAIELSESKKCVFPISEITFWEVIKQGDTDSRDKTIGLIDKLSEGISIINSDERIHLEPTHFIKKRNGNETYEIVKEVVKKGGSAILLDCFEDMKNNCTKYLELR